MKEREIMKSTTNRGEYNRVRKYVLEADKKIHCAYCRYHKMENAWGFRRPHRSWKRWRKTQYKGV